MVLKSIVRLRFGAKILVGAAILIPTILFVLAGLSVAQEPQPAPTAPPAQAPQAGEAESAPKAAAPEGEAKPESPQETPKAAQPKPGEAAPKAKAPAAADGAPAALPLPIIYLGKEYPEPLPLSYAEEIITDKGIQGARLMIKEANQAGRFLGHAFELVEAIVPEDGDVVAKAKEVLQKGDAFIVANLEAPDLLAVADLPEAKNSVIMNVGSNDVALRQEQCRQNVFHVTPDWAMRADALAQYLIWKKWPRWAIIQGNHPADKDFVAQIHRSAKRYGGKIVDERVYTFPPGARNLDSGHQQVQSQMPLATQGADKHHALWVADNEDGFGDYLPFRTYDPVLVVGTQGLQALAWDKSYTESGAMHFQNAIPRLAKRKATERDYTAWLGVRSITDSILRAGKNGVAEVKEFLLSDQFRLEGFKGQALSFRTWDHQMRQPVILGGGTRVPVTTSPQEGFLHPTNLTDTLGFDQPETKCEFK
jgi:ABC transporter substrate binding protein (PQQ-dependent alcohol dehydrogenase system)